MTINPNDNNYKYHIDLAPPDQQSTGVDAPKKAEITITDTISGESMKFSGSIDKLGKITIHMDPNNPQLTPPPGTGYAVTGDPGGRGNPFLSPIPFVQVSLAMLKLYEVMRESNLGMAAFENSAMKLIMEFAKTEADLIKASANKDAQMAILEAVASGIAAVGAAVSIGMTIKAMAKPPSLKTAEKGHADALAKETPLQKKVDTAKTKLNDAKVDVADENITQKSIAKQNAMKEERAANLADSNATPDQKAAAKAKAESAMKELDSAYEQRALLSDRSTPRPPPVDEPTATTSPENISQAKMNKLNEQVEVRQTKFDNAKTELDTAQAEIKIAKGELDKEQGAYNAKITEQSQLGAAISGFISSGGKAITEAIKAVFIIEKGDIEARQKIMAALHELIGRVMDASSTSRQKSGDVMSGLIQALEKIDNEHVNASSI